MEKWYTLKDRYVLYVQIMTDEGLLIIYNGIQILLKILFVYISFKLEFSIQRNYFILNNEKIEIKIIIHRFYFFFKHFNLNSFDIHFRYHLIFSLLMML